eukprot:GFUD01049812.1.p1 GENE.GFUD01049812.1~~GFUD01049812.1.p1  ORF type:complete len:127 (-),score=19.74 GFUD01049812.1:167-547(-)
MSETKLLCLSIRNLSTKASTSRDLLEDKLVEERQMIDIIVVVGLLFFIALTIFVNKISQIYSPQNMQNLSPQVHHVLGSNLDHTSLIIKPAPCVLPDYQTVIRMEEEEVPTYLEATNTGNKLKSAS